MIFFYYFQLLKEIPDLCKRSRISHPISTRDATSPGFASRYENYFYNFSVGMIFVVVSNLKVE